MRDFSREGVTWLKILQLFRLFHPKNTKTLARLDKFAELDLRKIEQKTGLKISGIILDVDGCIATDHGPILPENVRHIKRLRSQGVGVVLYSNMQWTERYKVLEKSVEVLTGVAPKPDPQGFREAVKKLGLQAGRVVVVGDSYISDAGCLRVGIPFIKVKEIRSRSVSLNAAVQKWLRWFYDKVSRVHGR